MSSFKNILVPVDLSDNCQDSISLATQLAQGTDATLLFCYVALPPLPAAAAYSKDEMDAFILREHAEFKQIKPDDLTIKHEHLFLRGNPGPEIVQAASDRECDLVVLSTHGRTGFVRWLMGSVAEYVSRNANCPVMTVRMPGKSAEKQGDQQTGFHRDYSKSPFVTSAMRHVIPVFEHQEMATVVIELKAASCTGAPVVNESNECIGILTNTDIDRYFDYLRQSSDSDKAGSDKTSPQEGTGTNDDHLVKQYMTSPVITVQADMTCAEAKSRFESNPDIHHLVILDQDQRAIGIVAPADLEEVANWNIDNPITVT